MAKEVRVDGGGDTSHLYEGKTIRSSAPSRKKAAGRLKSSTEIPKDACLLYTSPSPRDS